MALLGRVVAAVASAPPATRPSPADKLVDPDGEAAMAAGERALSGALMRVNHVGEVCAQALYEGQALTARSEALRADFRKAAEEEGDHLAWTRARLGELGARPSLLNPLWYGGALLIGMAAGRLGDSASLGFMAETERQVEQHLAGHLERLPAADARSRAIVAQMKDDERAHADRAVGQGAATVPAPARLLMRVAARVMTGTAHVL
jgi:ubiquinone biosynthesis monooxygenase Coq7